MENIGFMGYFGVIAFVLVISNMELPNKVKKLKEEIRKIKNSIKGEAKMSEVLKGIEGKRCKIVVNSGPAIDCEVVNVDDWIEIKIMSAKTNQNEIKIIRIDRILELSIV